MSIKVLAIDSSAWDENNLAHTLTIGEFQNGSEALTGIWRDLVAQRKNRAYLLFRSSRWLKYWRTPTSIVWGGLYKGMPRIYQEAMNPFEEKKATKLRWLAR